MAKHLVICGHGQGPKGYDPGAMNANGTTEAEQVRELVKYMQKYSTNIEYVTDRNVYEYRDIAKYKGYTTITELHMNAFNRTAKGAEVIIYAKYNEDNVDKAILNVLTKYFVNRGFKKRDNLYNVNVAAKSGFNYRLVELCFIDNDEDLRIFKQNIDSIAKGLVEAITGNKVSVLEQLNKNANVTVIERGGTRTPDTTPETLKELFEGNVVEVRQQATHYYNGKPINTSVNGQKYTITGKMAIDNQYSKFAYRLAQNGVSIGWVYAHDIVEAYHQLEPLPPQKESQKITLGGKNYIITEE